MNSQESRSDLENIEDEEGTRSPALEPPRPRSEAPESLNGPLGPSEASIASNLQAMSTQMFQTKRCFRLAPTFSNLLLQPPAEAPTAASRRPCVNGDADKPSEPGIWASGPRPAGVHTSSPSPPQCLHPRARCRTFGPLPVVLSGSVFPDSALLLAPHCQHLCRPACFVVFPSSHPPALRVWGFAPRTTAAISPWCQPMSHRGRWLQGPRSPRVFPARGAPSWHSECLLSLLSARHWAGLLSAVVSLKFFYYFIYHYYFFFNVYLLLRQRQSVNGGGSERGRHRIRSRLSAQSPTRGSNSWTVKSQPEPKSAA